MNEKLNYLKLYEMAILHYSCITYQRSLVSQHTPDMQTSLYSNSLNSHCHTLANSVILTSVCNYSKLINEHD